MPKVSSWSRPGQGRSRSWSRLGRLGKRLGLGSQSLGLGLGLEGLGPIPDVLHLNHYRRVEISLLKFFVISFRLISKMQSWLNNLIFVVILPSPFDELAIFMFLGICEGSKCIVRLRYGSIPSTDLPVPLSDCIIDESNRSDTQFAAGSQFAINSDIQLTGSQHVNKQLDDTQHHNHRNDNSSWSVNSN